MELPPQLMGGFGPNRPRQILHARWEQGKKKEEKAQERQGTNNDCNINLRTPMKRTRKTQEQETKQQKKIPEKCQMGQSKKPTREGLQENN